MLCSFKETLGVKRRPKLPEGVCPRELVVRDKSGTHSSFKEFELRIKGFVSSLMLCGKRGFLGM